MRKCLLLISIICIGAIILHFAFRSYLKVKYYLWKLETETPKISEHEYNIKQLISQQVVGISLERTETMESLIKMGPQPIPYILKKIEDEKVIAQGILIINEIYFKENNLVLAPSLTNQVVHYSCRNCSLLPQIWPFVESENLLLKKIGLNWIHYIGESGDEYHARHLIRMAENEREDPHIRERSIMILDSWKDKGYLSIARRIVKQPDEESFLRVTCFNILIEKVDQDEIMSLLKEGLYDECPTIRFQSAKKLIDKSHLYGKEVLRVLIQLLTCDDGTMRAMSWQQLLKITGKAFGTCYILEMDEDLETSKEYFEKVNQMSVEERARWQKMLEQIWLGKDDKKRALIAVQWNIWYEGE